MKQIICQLCSKNFDSIQTINGKRYTLYKRRHCIKCVPLGTRAPIYSGKLSYTKNDLECSIATSLSMRQALLKLHLRDAATNYRSVKRMCKYWNIATDHFIGIGWSIGRKFGPKRPISEYLDNKHPIGSHQLKERLIREKILEHKCSCCQRTIWNDLPIPIQLDHINGNTEDNRLENLRILCPNCHAQTSTYCSKNKKH